MKVSSFAATAILVAIASGQGENITASEGPTAGDVSNPTTASSRSVYFNLWYSGDDNGNNGPNWTWTTNVQTSGVSDSDVPNAQILNTQYAFSWPNSGDLSAAVAQGAGNTNTSSFCVTVVESLFPSDVLKNYNEDTGENAADGSCQNPLRKRCYDAITSAFQDSEPNEQGCRGTDLNLGSIKQCEWSFDHEYQASTFNLLNNASIANATSGSGVIHMNTGVYDGSNQTLIQEAEGRLQMIIIDSGSVYTPLCMRVDTQASSQQGSSNDASVAGANIWLLATAGLIALLYVL